jgi:hypothetical protein
MKHRRAWIAAILPLVLGSLVGCPWSPGKNPVIPPPVSKYLPQSSMVNVLANLKTAYEDRHLEEYKKLFSQDYAFVFSPADYGNPDDPTPQQWGRDEEFTSTENMFHNELVDKITLDYVAGVPERADTLMYPGRTWKMKVDNANLQVSTRNAEGEQLIYQVPGTTEMFFFREVLTTLASDGRPTWYIFRWEDQPIGAAAVAAAVPARPNP